MRGAHSLRLTVTGRQMDAEDFQLARFDGLAAAEPLGHALALLGRDVAVLAGLGVEADAHHVAEHDVEQLVGLHGAARVVGARVASVRHRLGRVDCAVRAASASRELALLVAVDGRGIAEQVAHGLDVAAHALLQGAEERAVLVCFEGLGIGLAAHGDDHGFKGGLHGLFLSGM